MKWNFWKIGRRSCLLFVVFFLGCMVSGCGSRPQYLQAEVKAPIEDAQDVTDGADAAKDVGQNAKAQSDTKAQAKEDSGEQETGESCFVYVCGAVEVPGVYEVPQGSRVYEVIQQAGGLTKEASPDAVNQAEQVTDGQMIEIPTQEEQREQVAEEAAVQDGLVNINTATVAQLMTLSGIGEAKAGSIVAYREEHGWFQATEELMNVSGIGEGVFARIRDKITV